MLDASPAVGLPGALRRLDETGVFFPVIHTNSGGREELVIRDKWTAVPVVTFKRGGEATVVRVGAADDNFVGTMAAVAFYADFLSGYGGQADARSVSFSIFVRWRRFLGYNLLLELGRTDVASPDALYDRTGRETGSLLFQRQGFSLGLGREFVPHFFLIMRAGIFSDRLSDRTGTGLVHPEGRTDGGTLLLEGVWDNTVKREYLTRGWVATVNGGFAGDGMRLGADLRWYHLDGRRNNLALRLYAGWTEADDYGQLFHAGGTDSLRGFYRNGFTGRLQGLFSAEYRINLGVSRLFRRDFFFWQLNFFTDAGYMADQPTGLADAFAGSVGAGLRIATVPISNNLLRVDLAWGYCPYSRFDIVVATAHYF